MLSKEKTLALLGTLATASVTGIGLAIGGPIGATVMAGIGINLSSSIIQSGCFNLKERWVHSENGILNHDVQKALARAVIKALASLENKYFETEQAEILKGYERESIRELFRELQERARTILPATFEEANLSEEVWNYLVDLPGLNIDETWDAIVGDDFLTVYGSDFGDFIRQNLLNEILFWFNEELKTDSKENNKAWRAFQRMLLEGIYADVKSVKTNQDLISQDLRKLDLLTAQMNELQDVTGLFQKELENGISEIRSTLQTISNNTRQIDQTLGAIHQDVRDLLGKQKERPSPEAVKDKLSYLRRRMISADSEWELRETLYEVEDLLSDHPNAEARHLKHRLEIALSHEKLRARPEPMAERAIHAALPSASYRSKTGYWIYIVIGLIALGLYLLFRWIF